MFFWNRQKNAVKSQDNRLWKVPMKDAGVVAIFVGAISVLILVACYVIYRLSSERAYREKWKDYNDCGWA